MSCQVWGNPPNYVLNQAIYGACVVLIDRENLSIISQAIANCALGCRLVSRVTLRRGLRA